MITVSLSPYAIRKIGILIIGLICLLSVSCFADSIYLTVALTPYDGQVDRPYEDGR